MNLGMHDNTNSNSGFTLIESVLYISLMAIFIAVLGAISVRVYDNDTSLVLREEILYSGRFAMAQIFRNIQDSTLVNVPIAGATSSTLSLKINETEFSPTVFNLEEGVIYIKKGQSDSVAITSSKVEVQDIKFTNLTSLGETNSIKFEITLRPRNSDGTIHSEISETFYSGVTIRSHDI